MLDVSSILGARVQTDAKRLKCKVQRLIKKQGMLSSGLSSN
jgi:hypothetical protein